MTGKTGLTFQEALESEAAAMETINEMSQGLRKALLYLCHYLNPSVFKDLCHILWSYASCRYFVGEEVEALLDPKKNIRTIARIIRVVPPTGTTLANASNQPICYGIDPTVFRYEIVAADKKYPNFRCIVSAHQIARCNGNITKDKVKLLLKMHTTTSKRFTITQVKEKSMVDYDILSARWDPDIFAGPFPKVDPDDPSLPSKVKRKRPASTSKSESKEGRKKLKSSPSLSKSKKGGEKEASSSKKSKDEEESKSSKKSKKEKVLSPEEEKRRAAETKKQAKIEAKKRALEEKERLERERKEWTKPRDDLECDDLKPLPTGVPISCPIPSEVIGDALMILEFYNNFSEFFELEEIFPHGFTFDLLVKTLTEQSIKSPISDLLRITLQTIYALQEETDNSTNNGDESNGDKPKIDEKLEELRGDTKDDEDNRACGQGLLDAMKAANAAVVELKRLVGKISAIKMNAFTITEVLRQHLLTSGSYRVRTIYRGWYNSREDPALTFKIEHPLLMEKLGHESVYNLDAPERILIFHVLIHQLMTFERFRIILDDSIDKIVEMKKEIRQSQADYSKWEREELAAIKTKRDAALLAAEDPATYEDPKEVVDMRESFNGEKEKRVSRLQQRHLVLKAKIRSLEGMYGVKPLGRDRAYRRYWLFNSLSGLFVERDEINPGPCVDNPCGRRKPDITNDLSPANNKENEFSDGQSGKKSKEVTNGVKSALECSGESKTCPIHGPQSSQDVEEDMWTFYPNPEDVDEVIAALNERGWRETLLKKSLTDNLDVVKESISKCPSSSLNPILSTDEVRKSSRVVFYKPGSSVPSYDVPPSEALKLSFVETLETFDEQLFASGFSFRPNASMSHDDWKSQLSKVDLKRSSSAKELANLLAKLAECIIPQHLTPPLGTNGNANCDSTGGNTSTSSGGGMISKWIDMVKSFTSFSQLFFLLDVLDSSINWSASALSAYCRFCRKKRDPAKMLICDGCNRGHHMYCLKPPLESVPSGEWLCSECKTKSKPKTPVKNNLVMRDPPKLTKMTTRSMDPGSSHPAISYRELDDPELVDLGDDETIPDDENQDNSGTEEDENTVKDTDLDDDDTQTEAASESGNESNSSNLSD